MATDPNELHDSDTVRRRPLFRRADVVVLVTILLFLAGFMIPASVTVRTFSIRLACANNLHQIGLGIHNYHDAFSAFPNPDVPTASAADRLPDPGARAGWGTHTIYADLLPYVEQRALAEKWQADPEPVKTYICPGRRAIGSEIGIRVKAPDDYGIGMHPDWFAQQTTPGLNGNPAANGYPPPPAGERLGGTAGWYSILGGQWTREASGPDGKKGRLFPGTSLGVVADADGTANTLLMAHKGVPPLQYSGGSPTDLGWNVVGPASRAVQYEHMRCPFGAAQDFNLSQNPVGENVPFCDWSRVSPPASPNSMDWLIGSPHPGGMPCLFADGSVRAIAYGSPTDPSPQARGIEPHLWVKLWAFNDSQPIEDSHHLMEPPLEQREVWALQEKFGKGVLRWLFSAPLIACAVAVAVVLSLTIAVRVFIWLRRRGRGSSPSA